jgi:hypothetical protein
MPSSQIELQADVIARLEAVSCGTRLRGRIVAAGGDFRSFVGEKRWRDKDQGKRTTKL